MKQVQITMEETNYDLMLNIRTEGEQKNSMILCIITAMNLRHTVH